MCDAATRCPSEYIAEILKPPLIREILRAPLNVVGIISVRGKLVAVMDPDIAVYW